MAERIKRNAPIFYFGHEFGALNLRSTKFPQLIVVFPAGIGIPDVPGAQGGRL